jgi:hypothetical protein
VVKKLKLFPNAVKKTEKSIFMRCSILKKERFYVAKSGLSSGFSLQHWRIMLIASGGAAPFETDGLMSGGGFIILAMISSGESESIQ